MNDGVLRLFCQKEKNVYITDGIADKTELTDNSYTLINENKLIRKTDIIIIISVIFAAGIFILLMRSGDEALTAVISVDGEVVERINLDEVKGKKEIIPGTDPAVVIAAEKGTIYFESAECPDKICVRSGKLSRRGDTAVCLPSKTVITVTGGNVDAVTY